MEFIYIILPFLLLISLLLNNACEENERKIKQNEERIKELECRIDRIIKILNK